MEAVVATSDEVESRTFSKKTNSDSPRSCDHSSRKNRFFTETWGNACKRGQMEVVISVGLRRRSPPRLFHCLSLLKVERPVWATRELCELVHRFEPKRVQQGTQDFVPSTNMCVQLHRHLPLCRKTGQGMKSLAGSRDSVPGRRRPLFPNFP